MAEQKAFGTGDRQGKGNMFCTGCGKQLKDGSTQCPYCGKQLSAPRKAASAPPAKKAASAPPQQQQANPGKTRKKATKRTLPPLQDTSEKSIPRAEAPDPNIEPEFIPRETDAGIDVSRAFSYLFQEPDWVKKCIILGLVMIVPILNFAVIGYFVELARRVSNAIDTPVPEFELADQWKSGLMYALVYIIVSIISGAVFAILAMLVGVKVIGIFAMLLLLVFSVAFSVYFCAAASLAIIEGNPWVVFQFPACFEAIQKNPGPVFLTVVLMIPVSMIAGAGSILFGVGYILTAGIALFMSAHIFGQLGRAMRSNTKL